MLPNNHDWILVLLTGVFVGVVLLASISQVVPSYDCTVKEEKV